VGVVVIAEPEPSPEERALEAICGLGCDYVNRCIEALEQGQSVAEAQRLSPLQRRRLLDELRAVMGPYRRPR